MGRTVAEGRVSRPNGQVENQVGVVRERLFKPRLRFRDYAELNAWLLEQCVAYARVQRHPEIPDRTIWEVFEAERAALVPYAGRFDGFHAVPAPVSKTCLVRFDNNRYSVASRAVGRPVEAACAEALAGGVFSNGVVLNILSRRRAPTPPVTIVTPDALRLQHPPLANCARYDTLRSPDHGTP